MELDLIPLKSQEQYDAYAGTGEEYEPQGYAGAGEEYEPQGYAGAGEEYEPQEYAEAGEEYGTQLYGETGEEYAEQPYGEPEIYAINVGYGAQGYAEDDGYGAGEYTEEFPAGDERYVRRKPAAARKKRKKQRQRRSLLGLLFQATLLLLLFGLFRLLLPYYCVKPELTIEAGGCCPKVSEFMKWNNKNAVFVSDIQQGTVLEHVGDYGVLIQVYGRKVAAVLHVRDTVAPKIVGRNLTINGGQSVAAEDFIEEISDQTEVKLRFKEKPDCTVAGPREVVLLAEDEGGNVSELTVLLDIIFDREPPVIHGVKELTMTAGTSISYKKGITVTDDYDEDVELTVDTSRVDTNTPGDYTIVYSAVDRAGNETRLSTILHVKPVTVETVSEDYINAEADKVLAEIFKDGMSQYDQAKAIYDWCHSKIAYSDGTPKTNWVQGAYYGIISRKGDCYVYASTAKCLLTRAGITNMDIERIPSGTSMHYWNIIDIGEGWHHFDTCRRADGSTFFYKTDAEIKAYSDAHNGTHNYDRTKYPEIP